MSQRRERVRLKTLLLACDIQDRTGAFDNLKNVAVVGMQQIMTAAASSAMLSTSVSKCEAEIMTLYVRRCRYWEHKAAVVISHCVELHSVDEANNAGSTRAVPSQINNP